MRKREVGDTPADWSAPADSDTAASSFDLLLRDAAETPELPAPRSLGPGAQLLGGRFLLARQLGEGGMGVVYEALDSKTKGRVALKLLSRVDAAGIYRFKKEFRALADVVHEGLIGLHELFAEDGTWFFTMEIVAGVPFIEYVREDPAVGFERTIAIDMGVDSGDGETVRRSAGVSRGRGRGVVRERALRESLSQLASAINAIHRAGKLHRDLKPSNVLVTRTGRVVVLDFGLVSDRAGDELTQTLERSIAGTPAYMAPEQVRGERATTASDWYALGVMLYEALCGTLPFAGPAHEVMVSKLQEDPTSLAIAAPGAPADLVTLCMELLRREPAERPETDEILRRLIVDRRALEAVRASTVRADLKFVGREGELTRLWEAFDDVRRGSGRTAFVHGPSGMGKTTLVEQLLERAASGAALVLRGRCYEREEVPFKALDGIVDALSRHLARLDPALAALVLPRDVHSLIRVFPVLGSVPVVASAPSRARRIEEPIELRRVAFAALRELLQRLGDQQPLILFIDDLHWGDASSAPLVSSLLEPPDAPVMLLILAYRDDEAEKGACLRELLDRSGAWTDSLIRIEARELAPGDALELARRVLGEGALAQQHAAVIAAEAGGHPYFIAELARSARADLTLRESTVIRSTLEGLIAERVAAQPENARRLLDILALCGRPLPMGVALDAARVPQADRSALVSLVASHLARATRINGVEAVETYHDRVRAGVTSALPPERQQELHREIVRALHAMGGVDPNLFVEHLAGSGDVIAAREYAVRAARSAAGSYAHDTAASLYRRALDWIDDRELEHAVRVSLAEALRDSGRAAEAGWAYLEAGNLATGDERTELRRWGAEQLLLAGHIEAVTPIFEQALREYGLELPASGDDRTLLELLGVLAGRGLEFAPKKQRDIARTDLHRADLFWSIGWGMNVASYRGAPFLLHHLLEALEIGEEARLVRGFAMYTAVLAALHAPGAGDAAGRTEQIARRLSDERSRYWVEWARSVVPYWRGRFREARHYLARAELIIKGLRSTASKELGTVRVALGVSLWHSGELGEFVRCVPEWLRDAEQRHDLFTAAWLRTLAGVRCLILNDVPAALETSRRALELWRRPEDDDWLYPANLVTRMWIQLYTDSIDDGLITELERLVEGPYGWIPFNRSVASHEAGRVHLWLAARSANSEYHLGRAEECALAIEQVDAPSHFFAAVALRAGVAISRGRRAEALELLRDALREPQDPERRTDEGWILRRRLGELLGGDEGRRLVQHANSAMREAGIRNPDRWTGMMWPGFQNG